MKVVRRALAVIALSGTALVGGAVVDAGFAQARPAPVPTSLTISAPARVTYGNAATIKGVLTATVTHKALSGQQVTLEERFPGTATWKAIGSLATAANGSVSFGISPTRGVQVQLVHPANGTTKATTSATANINVAYSVTAVLTGKVLTATVAPAAGHDAVLLQLQGKNKQWSTVQTAKLATKSQATFTIKPPAAKGTYNYRVLKPAAHGYLQGASNTLQIVVP